MKKIFQDSDADRFCKMWREGASMDTMVATFGLKETTIRKYAKYKFNLPNRKRTCQHSILSDPKKLQFLKRNYADMGDKTIGVLIGENADWVRRTARRLGLRHSEQYRRDDYAYRAKKTSKTRKEKYAEGVYSDSPRDEKTGRFTRRKRG